ncbi:transposase [Streptomyces klenkii]|uniref:transposase n=1 Tax=Streptomyces klenkii TaxID=1420899 RepID=UPI0033A5C2E3
MGTIEHLGTRLHRLVREKEGCGPEPTACVIDAPERQNRPHRARWHPGHRRRQKIVGRKRSIVADILGLLLLVMVTAASFSDNEAGKQLLTHTAATRPTLTKAWVDTGYKNQAIEHGAKLGINVVPRNTHLARRIKYNHMRTRRPLRWKLPGNGS